jgi:predicted dehydrogenase
MTKLKLGVIGTGSVVREIYQHFYFASQYSQLLSIEAVTNRSEASRHEFCDKNDIPRDRRFGSYEQMIAEVPLDAVQVNTPDNLHEEPAVHALRTGLDVIIPKPLADTIAGAHRIIATAKETGRFLGIDFHKREDPRIKEARARYRAGAYGRFQLAVWYMLDKLLVADPNHEPRFFASDNFAQSNSPISFLTVHMADALIHIVGLKPLAVRANAWSQKLPSLAPIAVDGFDMCDTEVRFEGGGVAHIITGWHVPNGAHAMTVQSGRIICTDGMLDLNLDQPGYHELAADGIQQRNPLFRNFESDGTVSGYGMSQPGKLYQQLIQWRQGNLSEEERTAAMDPVALGFWTTVVLEAAEQSLKAGKRTDEGVFTGKEVSIADLLKTQLGEAAGEYL